VPSTAALRVAEPVAQYLNSSIQMTMYPIPESERVVGCNSKQSFSRRRGVLHGRTWSEEQTKADVSVLENLFETHDAVFLLMGTRKAAGFRWCLDLPTFLHAQAL
jgi:hypothetical protein